MSDAAQDRKKIIQKVIKHAQKKLTAKEITPFEPFIEYCFSHAPLDDLTQRSTRDLFGVALSLWKLMHKRKTGEYKRRIFNPTLQTDGWESTHTVLEFNLDDQPFLVDTLCTEINREGLAVHFLIHLGGIKVLRNTKHEITGILPPDSSNSEALTEAPIYIEIDRQTDPKVLKALGENLDRVIGDARLAVQDWKKLQGEVYSALEEMEAVKPPATTEDIEEAKAFLRWLLDNHFTFLGYRLYDFVMDGQKEALKLVKHSGLGVLRETSQSKLLRYYADLTPEARKLGLSNQILLLAKTNTRSTVHGNRYTDFVSVKRFNAKGAIIGERWFVGLYTSNVYNDSPRTFPLIRLKISEVLKRSGLPPKGHAHKALAHILETLPRDDLFHSTPKELYDLSLGILELQDRRCIRLFVRKDIYGRFISCLVYVPRDDFNVELGARMQEILQESFSAIEISYETRFFDSILARIHYTIRINPKQPRSYDLSAIERRLIEAGRSWKDGLHEQLIAYFGEEKGNALYASYYRAFPAAYKEAFSPQSAVFDIEHIEKLNAENNLEMSLYQSQRTDDLIHFKLFHPQTTIPLSDAIPILEKMGLRVIGEQPYQLQFNHGRSVWINDFSMRYSGGELNIDENRENFQEAFKKIWNYEAEHDGFNSLVLLSHLNWRETALLRAFAKYLKQIGFTFSQEYMEATLARNPEVTQLLIQMFFEKFDPAQQSGKTTTALLELSEKITQALEGVANLDEDRILRMYLNLIHAMVRVNYFQNDALGDTKPYLSFKFNPDLIHDLPLPKPAHEIFVYSPRLEGIHLRAGKVARGGIRWSDRREDFRREVLGLMKAQQVKNAIIVPAGSKGGFIPKLLPTDGDREQILQEGIHCYQDFIRGLLDLTDNMQDHTIIPPANTVCYDDSDPYLVVAADKGTATFSDIANAISLQYQFWLGDAFASGGSAGYDHKKIGITARGAWESVKRHFQELEIDIDNHPFTVVGIGDMSGDVFGNGMLQSKQIKLVGAFNGTHIFLDPDPDPAISFVERQRLFNLPRSTWEDYNEALISTGGGVFKRSVKTIKLSPEIKKLLNIKKDQIAPNDLVQTLLKAPVDLLWNGGIGTYVKASTETHLDAGDRSNDGVRVNGDELKCRVVCEGGNLGLTQLGRIEYELNGGCINTDFIDNSGGVDCSDHEVNIKILLNHIVSQGELTEKNRNILLAKMTDEVAQLVLHDNYRQVRALSINTDLSLHYLDLYSRYIKEMVKEGKLDRELEYLPSDETLVTRKANGKGFTRPEIAVLLAYSKNILKAEIIDSDLADEDYLNQYIQHAFPQILRKRYGEALNQHRLRREIIATQLSNTLINDMGITFVYQMHDETRADTIDIVRAYIISKEIFNLRDLRETIESLNIKVTLQVEMILELVQLIRRQVRWFLRNLRPKLDIKATIAHFASGVTTLKKNLGSLLTSTEKSMLEEKSQAMIEAGVPEAIAIQVANAKALSSALNIIEAATEKQIDLKKAAKIYFNLADRLGLNEFRETINKYPFDSRWTVLARSAVKSDLDWLQRALMQAVLKQKSKNKDPVSLVEAWLETNHIMVERWETIFTEIKANPTPEYAMLVVAVRELMDLVQVS
ncbi:MAG TPA: NAD-glutamate dehydrogenase [Gammaproteobacteria bacterium]|nr:NAD-glutamate dehydrogenase [Gammaproteobacteria bacterium]